MRGLSSLAASNEKGCSSRSLVASTASKTASKVVLRHVLVVDLRGLALAQVLDTGVIRLATQLASLHEAHYPETLSEAVLISSRQTAYITRMALSLVKPFLAERTRNKIRLVSDGPDLQQQLEAGIHFLNFRAKSFWILGIDDTSKFNQFQLLR